jgi:hypothetical protein
MHTTTDLSDIPCQLHAGDALTLRYIDSDFPRSDGFTARLVFIGPEAVESVDGAEDPSDEDAFLFSLTSGETATWTPGRHKWALLVEDAASPPSRHTERTGYIEILEDPAEAAAGDQRSHAAQMVERLEELLTSKRDVLSFSVFGRSYQFESQSQIYRALDYWRRRVEQEQEAERRAAGKASRNTIWMNFRDSQG